MNIKGVYGINVLYKCTYSERKVTYDVSRIHQKESLGIGVPILLQHNIFISLWNFLAKPLFSLREIPDDILFSYFSSH